MSADINEMTAPMAATRAPKKTPGPKSVDPTWAIVWPMIEIERPKTAMETPAIVSAIPRNGFTEIPVEIFPTLLKIAYMISRIAICLHFLRKTTGYCRMFTKPG